MSAPGTATALLAIAPVLVPLATALVAALCARRPGLARAVSLAGALAHVGVALAVLAAVARHGSVRVVPGAWPAAVGIEFVVDPLGAVMIATTALVGLACLVFMASDADPPPASGLLHALVHGLLAGASGAFATADLFNLYVWFEVMLLAALGLLALGGSRRQLDATFKYFVLNVLGTLLLLAAIAALYGLTGHLNFAALREAGAGVGGDVLAPALVLAGVALLVKSGGFPVFAWLPASYHTLPAPVLALFAAVLTKAGAFALLRLYGDVFVPPAALLEALGWVAVATMVAGVLGAAYHWDMRRILAVHIVSQIGYMLLAIALQGPDATVGAVFFLVHNMVVKANLFLIAAIAFRLAGSYDLRRIGGLWRAHPVLALLFLLQALSLVGLPPLSGFWAKFIVLRETLAQGHVAWAVAGFAVSLLTLYSMAKIWLAAFWKPHPVKGWTTPGPTRLGPAWAVAWGLAGLSLAMGLFPQVLVDALAPTAASLAGGR